MARFEDDVPDAPPPTPGEPSSDSQIYIVKSQIGHERAVGEGLSQRVRRNRVPVQSILIPAKVRGYLFVETTNPELLKEQLKGLTHARGMIMQPGVGKAPSAFGTVPLVEVIPFLTHKPVVSGMAEGNIVEIVSGPFKGEKALVQRIDEAKEEVTVELFEAMVPIPITVHGDNVRVLEKEIQ
jgi:transcription elongation factor SPT5